MTPQLSIHAPPRRRLLFPALLCLLVFGLHLNILDNEPTNWDDPALFTRQSIHAFTWDNLRTVLTVDPGSTYQPVRDLSYMIDFALWGERVVLGMHVHSMMLGCVMAVFCWVFLRELFGQFGVEKRQSGLWAGAAALLFAVHPVQVESIAWLYARKEPLLGIFTFLSLWAFLRGRGGRMRWYVLSVLAVILACLSKPTALVVPAMMMVIDLCLQSVAPRENFWRRRLWIYVPLLLVVVPFGLRLYLMMAHVGGIKPWHGGSVWTNALAVAQIYMSYVKLIAATVTYSADYPLELHADPRAWQSWAYVAGNVLLLGSAGLAAVKRRYLWTVFVVWFYLFILPVSNVLPIAQLMADRYALLSSLSWCVLLGWGVSWLSLWRPEHPQFRPGFPRFVAGLVFCFVLIGYGLLSWQQNDTWQNSLTLWKTTLARYPSSSPANVNISELLIKMGRYEEAQKCCMAALERMPDDYLAISNLALAQLMMGQHENAIHNYRIVLRLKPGMLKAELGLGVAYWLKRDYPAVYAHYRELFARREMGGTQGGDAMLRLAVAAWKLGKAEEAESYLDRAGRRLRENPVGLLKLGEVYISMGQIQGARHAYGRVQDLAPESELSFRAGEALQALD